MPSRVGIAINFVIISTLQFVQVIIFVQSYSQILVFHIIAAIFNKIWHKPRLNAIVVWAVSVDNRAALTMQ